MADIVFDPLFHFQYGVGLPEKCTRRKTSHVIYERSQNPALARGADLIFAAEISERAAEAAAAAGGGHSGG